MDKIPTLQRANDLTGGFSADERAILQERARQMARAETAHESAAKREFYLLVQLGKNEQYAIPYAFLDEVIPPQRLMKVPGVQECFAGVFNYRGLMMTAFDTRRYFGIAKHVPVEACPFVIINTQPLRIALLVDEILGNQEFYPTDLKPGLPTGDAGAFNCISGIFQGNIALINPEIMASDPVFNMNQAQLFQQ